MAMKWQVSQLLSGFILTSGVLLCSIWPSPAFSQASGTGNRGLVISFPGVSPEQISESIEKAPDGVPVTPDLKPVSRLTTDAAFIASLRSYIVTTLVREKNRCSPHPARFSGLLALAAEALAPDMRNTQVARDLLSKAEKSFVCGSDVSTVNEIADYFILSGVLHVYLEEPAQASVFFHNALALIPDSSRLRDASQEVEAAWEEAMRGPYEQPVDLGWVPEQLEGLQLHIDGLTVSQSHLSLLPGRHFLQLVRPDGTVAGGAMADVSVKSPGAANEWLPLELRVPTAREMLARLETADSLDSVTQVAFDELIKTEARPWVAIVLPGSSQTPSRTFWLVPGIDVQVVSASQARSLMPQASTVPPAALPAHPPASTSSSQTKVPGGPPTEKKAVGASHAATQIAALFGISALVSGSLLLHNIQREAAASSMEAGQTYSGNAKIAGAALGVSLFGAGISLLSSVGALDQKATSVSGVGLTPRLKSPRLQLAVAKGTLVLGLRASF